MNFKPKKIKELKIAIFGVVILGISILIFSIPYSDAVLWDGYYYMSLDESIDIWYPEQTALIYKSSDRSLIHDIQIKWNIKQVKYNENFIIANKIENNIIKCFIIKKKWNDILGPFTIKEYETKAKMLGVPKKLNCVEEL